MSPESKKRLADVVEESLAICERFIEADNLSPGKREMPTGDYDQLKRNTDLLASFLGKNTLEDLLGSLIENKRMANSHGYLHTAHIRSHIARHQLVLDWCKKHSRASHLQQVLLP